MYAYAVASLQSIWFTGARHINKIMNHRTKLFNTLFGDFLVGKGNKKSAQIICTDLELMTQSAPLASYDFLSVFYKDD